MFGSNILEIVIGLVFIYLLLSLLATTLNELIMSFLSLRGKDLERAIKVMLTDIIDRDKKGRNKEEEEEKPPVKVSKDLADAFYDHPLIKKFGKDKYKRPSYISRVNFSKVVIDLTGVTYDLEGDSEKIIASINQNIPDGDTKSLLISFVKDSQGDITQFKAFIEDWFDEMMDRTSGWYKRRVQRFLIILGIVIGMIFNADTFNISRKLSTDPTALEKTVNLATKFKEEYKKDIKSEESDEKIKELNNKIDILVSKHLTNVRGVLGMGWDYELDNFSEFNLKDATWWKWLGLKLAGLLITSLAIALGAPFWFDILNKVVNIRGTGVKPEEKKSASQSLK